MGAAAGPAAPGLRLVQRDVGDRSPFSERRPSTEPALLPAARGGPPEARPARLMARAPVPTLRCPVAWRLVSAGLDEGREGAIVDGRPVDAEALHVDPARRELVVERKIAVHRAELEARRIERELRRLTRIGRGRFDLRGDL